MLRKIILWGMLLGLVAAAAYGWMNYAVVALYDKETPKITHVFFLEKPYRDATFFYNYIDRREIEKQIQLLESRGDKIPWHLDYNYVVSNSIKSFTLDSSPSK